MKHHFIFYSVSIIAILILLVASFYLYERYNEIRRSQNEKYDEKREISRNRNIRLLNYLKFSHEHHITDNENISLFLIETIKIDNCKYILISKKGQSPTIIHANDCEFCLKNK